MGMQLVHAATEKQQTQIFHAQRQLFKHSLHHPAVAKDRCQQHFAQTQLMSRYLETTRSRAEMDKNSVASPTSTSGPSTAADTTQYSWSLKDPPLPQKVVPSHQQARCLFDRHKLRTDSKIVCLGEIDIRHQRAAHTKYTASILVSLSVGKAQYSSHRW